MHAHAIECNVDLPCGPKFIMYPSRHMRHVTPPKSKASAPHHDSRFSTCMSHISTLTQLDRTGRICSYSKHPHVAAKNKGDALVQRRHSRLRNWSQSFTQNMHISYSMINHHVHTT